MQQSTMSSSQCGPQHAPHTTLTTGHLQHAYGVRRGGSEVKGAGLEKRDKVSGGLTGDTVAPQQPPLSRR